MNKEKTGFQAHVFICTNKPDNPNKCGSKGSEDLKAELKERCKKEFGKRVRVSSSGCLGYCEHGIATVIYPQNDWYLELSKKDGDQVFEAVKKALQPDSF